MLESIILRFLYHFSSPCVAGWLLQLKLFTISMVETGPIA